MKESTLHSVYNCTLRWRKKKRIETESWRLYIKLLFMIVKVTLATENSFVSYFKPCIRLDFFFSLHWYILYMDGYNKSISYKYYSHITICGIQSTNIWINWNTQRQQCHDARTIHTQWHGRKYAMKLLSAVVEFSHFNTL